MSANPINETPAQNYRNIPGWGVDLDPKNRPMFPKELPSDVETVRGDVRDWQTPTHTIHVSVEHPGLTPVFGTSCPPGGLSGMVRDYAYRYSEATNRHWMLLVLADRIDMMESLVTSALEGKPDRYLKEKGWAAMPPRQRATTFAVAGLGILVAGVLIARAARR